MGERLVVKIKRNDKLLSTLYYHWSAYSEPAVNITAALYERVLSNADNLTDDELLIALIRFAELSTGVGHFSSIEDRERGFKAWLENAKNKENGISDLLSDVLLKHGGLDPCDHAFAANKFPDEVFETDGVSRNEGLAAISDETMKDQLRWAEGTIDIDLDTKLVLNDVLYAYTIADYLAETEDDEGTYVDVDDIPKIPIDLGEFSLEDIDIVKDVITINRGNWMRYEDTIYQLKEG